MNLFEEMTLHQYGFELHETCLGTRQANSTMDCDQSMCLIGQRLDALLGPSGPLTPTEANAPCPYEFA